MTIYEIINAKFIKNYTVEVVFNNGKKGSVDLQKYLNKGILKELLDKKKFKRFKVDKELGTIVWGNGADIAPETLYAEIMKK